MEVRQGAASPAAVVVDDLVIEQFRAPNFVPDQMSVLLIQPNNPTPFDDQVVPSPSQSFPGRTQQLWYTDPAWDQGGDAELHVPYSYYTLLSVGYDGTGPGAVLAPGAAPFVSVSVRLIYHDSSAWERKGLGVRKVQAALAPQMQVRCVCVCARARARCPAQARLPRSTLSSPTPPLLASPHPLTRGKGKPHAVHDYRHFLQCHLPAGHYPGCSCWL